MGIPGSANLMLLGGGAPAYEIEQSLRFNSGDSAWLNKTFSSAGSRTTWTFSCWIKGGLKSGNIHEGRIFGVGSDASGDGQGSIYYSANQLIFYHRIGSGTEYSFGSDARFRDPSAWHHLVVVWDTDNGTAADRWRFYDNGVRLTSATASTLPSGYNSNQNAAVAHGIGVLPTSPAAYFNGYLAEVNFIDGSALDPTDFGEFDDNGVWRPIKYAGSYTGNSFYLKFANGDGTDDSGLSNTWTANNFTTSGTGTDVMSDTPTNNEATWNPLPGYSPSANTEPVVYSEANRNARTTVTSSNASEVAWATLAVPVSSGGQYYWEFENVGSTNNILLGVMVTEGGPGYGPPCNERSARWSIGSASGGAGQSAGASNGATATVPDPISWDVSDRIGVLLDIDNSTIEIRGDDSAIGTFTDCNFDDFKFLSPFIDNYTKSYSTANATVMLRTGDLKEYSQSGYKELSTSGLPTPDIKDPGEHFNAVTYDGTGASLSITGVGFQPDFVWIKDRTASTSNMLFDVIRGAQYVLSSDSDAVELFRDTSLTSFDSDGFTVGDNSQVNLSSARDYVAWCWKAGGSVSADNNTGGTITSTVSANPTAGFSIVTYTGDGDTAATVGHGLGVAPSMLLLKERDAATDWHCTHTSIPNQLIYLNLSNAAINSSSTTNGGLAALDNSVTFGFVAGTASSVNNVNQSEQTYVAYCFAEVEGYSKFGSYEGNGNADGPFVYCGFKPAFVLIKCSGSTGNWVIFDTIRNTYNPSTKLLQPNDLGAEIDSSTYEIDILSNGFKIRASHARVNSSGNELIYAAFGENSFGGSGVTPATAR